MIFYREKFKTLREANGLTLVEFARRCNVTKQTVFRWETDKQPHTSKIPMLAKILKCKESDIAQYGGASGAPDRLPVVLDIKKIKKLIYDCGYSEAAFAKKINIPWFFRALERHRVRRVLFLIALRSFGWIAWRRNRRRLHR